MEAVDWFVLDQSALTLVLAGSSAEGFRCESVTGRRMA